MVDTDLQIWFTEVNSYVSSLNLDSEGERLFSNYQDVVAMITRLQYIHNEIAWEEITGVASGERKKFRTMILDHTIERLEKVAAYESRKLTALQLERDLER